MNFKALILSSLFLAPLLLQAQALYPQPHQHRPGAGCSVTSEMGNLIKERMLRNRANVPASAIEAIKNKRAITYLPMTLNVVGDDNGEGRIDFDKVLDMQCTLNSHYADQDIQFFRAGEYSWIDEQTLYNNAFSNGAHFVMNSNKVSNTINIYIGPSVNAPNASFYQPMFFGQGDYLFFLNAQMGAGATTAAHEAGHFLSLPHTFNGWESTDVEATYGCNAVPSSVGGSSVEKFARTGGTANCNSAADGFCDTEADYFSDREFCPYTGCAKDPLGNSISPDWTNYMSYSDDGCQDGFSNEQKNAILSDVVSRGWSGGFTPPTTAEISSSVVLTGPTNNQQIGIGSGSGNIGLHWDPVPNATGYYIEVDRSFFGSPLDEITRAVVYNTTTFWLDISLLGENLEYIWRVRPFNEYHTCGGFHATSIFKTTSDPFIAVDQLEQTNTSLQVFPNPVNGDEVSLNINSDEDVQAALRLYSIEGKLLTSMDNQFISAGETIHKIDVSALANGMYIAVLTTNAGTLSEKFVLER